MTSTNQAFINAFRSPAAGRSVVTGEGVPFVGTSEFVSAASPAELPQDLPQIIREEPASQATAFSSPFRFGQVGTRRTKRPLSSLRSANQSITPKSITPKLITPERPSEALHAEPRVAPQPTWPVVCQQLLAAAADQYDIVLRKLAAGTGASVVLGIVGATGGVGCTTTALCLALRSAALGYSTVLVDADLASPSIANQVAMKVFEPWNQLMQTSHTVAPALVSSGEVGVDLLLAGPSSSNDLNATARFRVSLAAGMLRRNYQRVIVDLGSPVAEKGDASLAMQLAAAMGVDHLIATVAPPSTDAQFAATLQQLNDQGLEVAGVVQAA